MPPMEIGGYLLGYLFEIGPVLSNGMGLSPISHQEIESWCRLARVDLAPWESKFLRRLSSEYISASRKAEKPGCQPPWQPEEMSEEEYRGTADGLRNMLRGMSDL